MKKNKLSLRRRFFISLQKRMREKAKGRETMGKVILFHEIVEVLDEKNNPSTTVLYKDFVTVIEHIREKYNIVSMDEFFAHPDKNNVVLTFDDGYQSFYENARPYLTENSIPYTCFITIDWIGKNRYIKDSQLMEYAADPLCTIGCHTFTHRILRTMNRRQQIHEIAESRTYLSSHLNKEIRYLAYPFGGLYTVSRRNMRQAQKAGYSYAFSTNGMDVPRFYMDEMRFYIPRMNMNMRSWTFMMQ